MSKVFVADRIPDVAKNELTDQGFNVDVFEGNGKLIDHKQLKEGVKDADYLITSLSTQVDKDIIDAAPNLKLIANYGAGFNNIDIDYARSKNIDVTNTPKVSTNSVAEVTIGMILGLAHRMGEGERLMRSKGFSGWAPLFFLGHEISGKTLGIIGFGSIGQAVAQKAHALGMKILYYQRHQADFAVESQTGAKFVGLDELLQQSDFVTIHAPATPENHHQIDSSKFVEMKKTAFLLNAGRGPIIDEQALVRALQDNEIAGAALDVYEHEPEVEPELKTMENVILEPHIGNATVEARDAMAKICADNIIKVSKNQPISAVN